MVSFNHLGRISNWIAMVPLCISISVVLACGGPTLELGSPVPQTTRSVDLARNRTGHTATLVADTVTQKTVLFVGGGSSACTGELYDVTRGSNVFESTCRIGHTATRLQDDSVLIVGGQDSLKIAAETHSSAELFEPGTGAFSQTGSLSIPRYGHNATLLSDGTVLITGGYATDAAYKKVAVASAELYDPSAREFSPLPDMHFARAGHTSTVLADGEVLIVGGSTESAQVEKYLPDRKLFQVVDGPKLMRSSHTATVLRDDTVLIAGGVDEHGATLSDAFAIDAGDADLVKAGTMNVGRAGHSATMLSDGSVLFIGGNGADRWALGSVEIYDPVFREFTLVTQLLRPRVQHSATYIESVDSVLVAGGWGPLMITGPVIIRDVELVGLGRNF